MFTLNSDRFDSLMCDGITLLSYVILIISNINMPIGKKLRYRITLL